MIDTVRLLLPIHNPLAFEGNRFSPITLEQLVYGSSYGKTMLNPSLTYAKTGIYMPRLTMFKRGRTYQLAIEFSAPSMIFGNNFNEIKETDFEAVVNAVQVKVHQLLGHKFFKSQIRSADVGAWHPSKNIILLDYTACQTILNTISKLDISRIYDLQKTDFRDGHIVHIHCNSVDFAFYDKMADGRKAKLSPKRAFEKDNLIQLNLIEKLEEVKPLEVLRYEVRFIGRDAVKRAYPSLEAWTFENLFKQDLSQEILLRHWRKLTASVDMLSLDAQKPYELFQNYIIENPDAPPQAALAAVTGLLINRQKGVVGLRNLIEARYGKGAWYRIKPHLKAPSANRFRHIQSVEEQLERFTPVNILKFIKNVENSGK